MHERHFYERNMRARLDALKAEIDALGKTAEQAEANLELEYFTLVDELKLKLETADQHFELLRMSNEDKWEDFRTELEHSWESLRELVKAVTAP